MAQAPGLARRLACFLYEGVLLFGVTMISGYLFSALTHQTHALQGREALQAFEFVVLAIYFCWFWSRGGQTVAMRAWRIRLTDLQGQPVSQTRAMARYVCSWVWFLPALGLSRLLHQDHSTGQIFAWMAAGVLIYAAAALLHPRRQFWHDAWCGTQLVDWQVKAPAKKA